MAIGLVSPIPVSTVGHCVVLTGCVSTNSIEARFTHLRQNWRKLQKIEWVFLVIMVRERSRSFCSFAYLRWYISTN